MRRLSAAMWIMLASSACRPSKVDGRPASVSIMAAESTRSAPFEYWHHLLVVPVRVNDSSDQKFILDTGAGDNVITPALCRRIGCTISGESIGKRMSGQEVRAPTSILGSLFVASRRASSVPASVFDLGLDPSIDGIVSLSFFKDVPFTIDYQARKILVEDERTLKARVARGSVSPIVIEAHELPSVTIKLALTLATGRTIAVEVDTGSDALILNDTFMGELGVAPDAPNVKTVKGRDETGYEYTRYVAVIPGPVRVAAAPEIQQRDLRVQFQRIIYDGLVGHSFLKQFTVTYDLPNRRMIFAKP
ncbi:retropepsin-like aspartic protease [Pendulispora albinea]|uniref:Retropepsin-like domain-containing protein n=1 Tax=Pendulispora albinea TaxID=2741071 RepID=A0ABZ2MAA2_9BACT